jgi:hypothetical protein
MRRSGPLGAVRGTERRHVAGRVRAVRVWRVAARRSGQRQHHRQPRHFITQVSLSAPDPYAISLRDKSSRYRRAPTSGSLSAKAKRRWRSSAASISSVPTGETLALLGPSGSGKSSLMAVLAGLERASQRLGPRRRGRLRGARRGRARPRAPRPHRHRAAGLPPAADDDRAGKRRHPARTRGEPDAWARAAADSKRSASAIA